MSSKPIVGTRLLGSGNLLIIDVSEIIHSQYTIQKSNKIAEMPVKTLQPTLFFPVRVYLSNFSLGNVNLS